MQATVIQGTGRKSFRSLVKNSQFMELELGGKTGSLHGDEPKGKVDWFVGYAISGEEKIAIAAITVNKKYWTVKSAYLAQTIFKNHFKDSIAEASARHYTTRTVSNSKSVD
jgi:beta-lactamase class D